MTPEARVYERLRDRLLRHPEIHLVSLHPPSGKSYDTDLIRFPVFRNGVRTRERSHVDVVFVWKETLFLIELKGNSSESLEDTAKLRELRDQIGIEELLQIIAKRYRALAWNSLRPIKTLVLGLGVEKHEGPTAPDFVVIVVQQNIIGHAGTSVSDSGKEFLRNFCDSVTF